jgi:hypothetical protein
VWRITLLLRISDVLVSNSSRGAQLSWHLYFAVFSSRARRLLPCYNECFTHKLQFTVHNNCPVRDKEKLPNVYTLVCCIRFVVCKLIFRSLCLLNPSQSKDDVFEYRSEHGLLLSISCVPLVADLRMVWSLILRILQIFWCKV